jgi:hypothetical protein
MTQPPHDEQTTSSPEELREQVERTRAELGDTVEALAAKTDVKTRAHDKAAELKGQAAAKAGKLKEQAGEQAGEMRRRPRTWHTGRRTSCPTPSRTRPHTPPNRPGRARPTPDICGRTRHRSRCVTPRPRPRIWPATTATCCSPPRAPRPS